MKKIFILFFFFTSSNISNNGAIQQIDDFSEMPQIMQDAIELLEPEQQIDDYQETSPFQENKYIPKPTQDLNNLLETHHLTKEDRYILEIIRDELEESSYQEIPKALIPFLNEIILTHFQTNIAQERVVHDGLTDQITTLRKDNEKIRSYFATHEKLPKFNIGDPWNSTS